jgi:hypothetical protein
MDARWFGRPCARLGRRQCLVTLAGIVAIACRDRRDVSPTVVVTQAPPASIGGPDRVARISGRVEGATGNHRIVLFARSGVWYVQPFRQKPYTTIQPDQTWSASIHLGSEYAALLVNDGYRPPAKLETLPEVGNDVLAVSRVAGVGEMPSAVSRPVALRFSGYTWHVRQIPSERGGRNQYDARNVRVAADGALHLSLVNREGLWTSAEVSLTRTLGYGTYAFVVRDLSALDPAAMLTLYTYDEKGPTDTFREMNIQVQRASPGKPAEGQAIVQPNYLAGNIRRYAVPAGTATHWFRWEPGRVVFGTSAGSRPAVQSSEDRRREFTVGVPTSGGEQVRINLCYVRKSPVPPRRDVEVVLERFQYFP